MAYLLALLSSIMLLVVSSSPVFVLLDLKSARSPRHFILSRASLYTTSPRASSRPSVILSSPAEALFRGSTATLSYVCLSWTEPSLVLKQARPSTLVIFKIYRY